MKLGMISLGCAKNLVDSELFLGLCTKYNIEITNDITEADIITINTCGFIDKAKEESLDTIMEIVKIKEENKNLKIIVMGCLVQRYLKDLQKEIPEVDYFIPIRDYNKLDDIFMLLTSSSSHHELSYTNRIISTGNTSCYVRIGDGCDNRCSYCAIPLIRGPYKSRPSEDILNEVKYLAKKGIKDITLISQDTSKYGIDLNNYNLANLLDDIANLHLFKTIRVLYLYPDEVTDEIINVFKKHEEIVNYFDIPIQHASNKLLKAMNRRGSKELIESLINKIRANIPNAVIRTTIIVGFPGETKEDFEILKDFIKKMKFERLGAFTYSDEENTKGYTMDHKVTPRTMNKRYNELLEIQKEIALEYNESRIGQTLEVLVEEYDEEILMFKTRSYAEAPDDADGYIYVPGDLQVGDYVKIKITATYDYDLIGEII
ncbi:MAG: 30S ribosomal protein S12 methylthiotransferase RimO [Coprobacillus sp.]|nr:30S ribosomal protein S12 methylthiotransferase RimO [Coprobacillus sp.]